MSELTDLVAKQNEESYQLGKKHGAILELEKIKSEFEEHILLNQTVAIQIIDKEIAELKGENKKECSTCKSDYSHEKCLGCIEYGHWERKGDNKQSSNNCQNNTDELSGECYECVKGIEDWYEPIAKLKEHIK